MRNTQTTINKIALLLATALITLISCTAPGPGSQTPDLAQGTEALNVDLKPITTNLHMCQETDIIATLHNKGASHIRNGIATLILEDQVIKPGTDTPRSKKIALEGKTQYNPRGEEIQLPLKLKNIGLPQQLETYTTPVIFSACYEYQTIASAPVCIDPDTLGKNPSKPCKVAPVTIGGQGAPIAITRVEPSMIPTGQTIKPTFVIYLQNLGSGRLTSRNTVEEACTSTTTSLSPTVEVSARLQDQLLTCTQNTVRIDSGQESRIACTSPKTYSFTDGTFTAILEVQIDYGYINTASETLTITRLPGQERCT